MIVRITGAGGQFEVADKHLDELNTLDDALEKAIENGDDTAFKAAHQALIEAVKKNGTPLREEDLHPSDLLLPPADATMQEVREMLSDEGLIPDRAEQGAPE